MQRICPCTFRKDITCNDDHCDIAGEDNGQCPICFVRLCKRKGIKPTSRRTSARRTGSRSASPNFDTRTSLPIVGQQSGKVAPCLHLGNATGRVVSCPSCHDNVRLKTFDCAKHGECTLAKNVPDVGCCKTCPDHTSRPVET